MSVILMNKAVKNYACGAWCWLVLSLFSNTAYSYSCSNSYEPWIATSSSGQYTVIRLVKDGVTNYELLRENESSLKFAHKFKNLRFQKVLDDGTFVAMETEGCGSSEITSIIHVIDKEGKLVFSATSEDLVEQDYLDIVKSANYYAGARMPWLHDIDVIGDSENDAKIVVRLFDYNKVEINVVDGISRYIPVPNLKDDAKGWAQRANWLGFIGEREKQLTHYSRALELAPEMSFIRYHLINHSRDRKDYKKAIELVKGGLDLEPLLDGEVTKMDSFHSNQQTNFRGGPISYQHELAELFEKQNNTSKAIELMNEILALNPDLWSSNLYKAQLELTDTNRNEVLENIDSVFKHHVAFIEKSNKDLVSKNIKIENFRESYASWLSINGYYTEAEIVLLLISKNIDTERSYYKFSREQNFEKLAENAKRNQDPEAELKYLMLAAEYSTSAYDLEKIAWRFVQGDGVEKNHKMAIEWFEKATELTYSSGDFFPLCYLELSSGERNAIKSAKQFCEKGVKANEGSSAFWLAMILLNEKRFKKKHVSVEDLAEIDKLLLLARNENYPSYGRSDRIDFDIYELSSDVSNRLSVLESLAEQGSVIAAFHLGELYEHGVGTEKNTRQAIKWFEKAASDGDAEAEYHFGKLIISSNTSRAISLLESSAIGGQPWAAIKLGELYYKGNLVDKDLQKMEYWLLFADGIMKEERSSSFFGGKRKTSAMRRLEEYRALK